MKILVIGGTGMLGQSLMKEALARNFSATGLSRRGAGLSCDVTDDIALARAIDKVQPQVIVNTAALTDLAECERVPAAAYLVNARCAGILAEQATKHKAYLIHVSTDHYYTGDGSGLHKEHAPIRLLNEYARTKYAGEHFSLTCPGSLVIRTNIVGFRGTQGKPTFVEWALGALSRRDPITLFDDFYTSSIDVTAFAAAMFDLLEQRPSGVLNVASREVASKKSFIQALADKLSFSLEWASVASVETLGGARRAESLGLDVSKAESLLGYRLPSLEEVITQLAKEYQERTNEI